MIEKQKIELPLINNEDKYVFFFCENGNMDIFYPYKFIRLEMRFIYFCVWLHLFLNLKVMFHQCTQTFSNIIFNKTFSFQNSYTDYVVAFSLRNCSTF